MGVLLKCFLGIFAIFCLMQFVEMDDSVTTNDNPIDLNQVIKNTLDQFGMKDISADDVGKLATKLTGVVQDVFKDGAKNLEDFASKVQTVVKENLHKE